MTPHHPPPRDPHARTEAERKLLAADGLPPEWDEWFYDDWFADIWREYTDESDWQPATPQQPADAGEEG